MVMTDDDGDDDGADGGVYFYVPPTIVSSHLGGENLRKITFFNVVTGMNYIRPRCHGLVDNFWISLGQNVDGILLCTQEAIFLEKSFARCVRDERLPVLRMSPLEMHPCFWQESSCN